MPVEIPEPDPVRGGREHASYDPRRRAALLAGAASRSSRCSGVPLRVSSASAARCTSSGAASTWRSPASPGAARPSAPGADAITQEGLFARSDQPSASGPAAAPYAEPRSTPTPRPSRTGFRTAPRCSPAPRITTRTFKEFMLPYEAVRTAASPRRRARRVSARARTTRRRSRAAGTGRSWNDDERNATPARTSTGSRRQARRRNAYAKSA